MRIKAALVVLAALAFLLLAIILLATLSFKRKVEAEVAGLFQNSKLVNTALVTEADLEKLPEPVQRYLRYTGVVGKPIPRNVRLKQIGRIRQDAASPWMEITAEEYYSINPPGFIWRGVVKKAGLTAVQVRDSYLHGAGSMLVKMLSIFPIVDAKGSEMDQGAMMRYLNEITWFPAAFLGNNIMWKAIDDHSAEVTLMDSGRSATATMYFDSEGKVINFVAERYRTVGNRYELTAWSTPVTGYGTFKGLRLPVNGQGVWTLAEGDLAYIELTLTDLEYD